MLRLKKAIMPILLAIAILITPAASAAEGAGDVVDITHVITDVADILQRTVLFPGIGQTGGDWAILSLMRSGAPVSDGYIRGYYDRVAVQIDLVQGELSDVKNSEFSRVALAMLAIGADPRDVGGYDLLEPLMDYDSTVFQGINGPIFALLTLSAAGYGDDPVVERYIGYILSQQLEDGGFALSGTVSDPDTTAMTLTALSGFSSIGGEDRQDVSDSIARAVDRLSRLQRGTGGFTSFSSTNSESVSQAVIALSSLGIQIDDERFVKNGNSLLDNLLTYYTEGLGFEHEIDGGISLMATEQALTALGALWRLQSGLPGLYDMGDAPPLPDASDSIGLPGKHPDISVSGIAGVGDVFTGMDIEDGGAVSRALFIAALVRALGLQGDGVVLPFKDVDLQSDYYDEIGAALVYGIVGGRSPDVFDPWTAITREEAAVVVYRASALCGLGVGLSLDETAIRNILSPFIDYRSASTWAVPALAFCYFFEILDDFDIEILPFEQILKEEAADMIYRMLARASLLETYP